MQRHFQQLVQQRLEHCQLPVQQHLLCSGQSEQLAKQHQPLLEQHQRLLVLYLLHTELQQHLLKRSLLLVQQFLLERLHQQYLRQLNPDYLQRSYNFLLPDLKLLLHPLEPHQQHGQPVQRLKQHHQHFELSQQQQQLRFEQSQQLHQPQQHLVELVWRPVEQHQLSQELDLLVLELQLYLILVTQFQWLDLITLQHFE